MKRSTIQRYRLPECVLLILVVFALVACDSDDSSDDSFTFMVLGDSRGPDSKIMSPNPYDKVNWRFLQHVVDEVVPLHQPEFVLFNGDMAGSHLDTTDYLDVWKMYIFDPLNNMGIPCYPVVGNHEMYQRAYFIFTLGLPAPGFQEAYQQAFSEFFTVHGLNNGPSPSYNGLAFWFTYKNAFFFSLDNYYVMKEGCPGGLEACYECVPFDGGYIPLVQQAPNYTGCVTSAQIDWLRGLTPEMTGYQHRIGIGHAPLYGVEYEPVLPENDETWAIMEAQGVQAYFAGHEHIYSRKFLESSDLPSATGKIAQVISGAAGANPDDAGNMSVDMEAFHVHFKLNYVIVNVVGDTAYHTAYGVTGTGKLGIDPPYQTEIIDQFTTGGNTVGGGAAVSADMKALGYL